MSSTVIKLKFLHLICFVFLHFPNLLTFPAATKRVSLSFKPITRVRTVPGPAWLVGFPSFFFLLLLFIILFVVFFFFRFPFSPLIVDSHLFPLTSSLLLFVSLLLLSQSIVF